ncbi:hypothetical protein F8M41_019302 [Gigaspora margarita]|uniref:Uncharacterized protein n=1 Tax=Gigaspora margarita TaxID=4874 RepID=A0A8H4AK87_GIGMA|nr:hypothetical protein F8M41_019302 [Gigaspora margarita]
MKQNGQLLTGIENFKKEYEKTESLSSGKLIAYLYQYKVEPKFECNQHQSNEENEMPQKNIDPTIMKARKKRKTSKKSHYLSKNINANRPN